MGQALRQSKIFMGLLYLSAIGAISIPIVGAASGAFSSTGSGIDAALVEFGHVQAALQRARDEHAALLDANERLMNAASTGHADEAPEIDGKVYTFHHNAIVRDDDGTVRAQRVYRAEDGTELWQTLISIDGRTRCFERFERGATVVPEKRKPL